MPDGKDREGPDKDGKNKPRPLGPRREPGRPSPEPSGDQGDRLPEASVAGAARETSRVLEVERDHGPHVTFPAPRRSAGARRQTAGVSRETRKAGSAVVHREQPAPPRSEPAPTPTPVVAGKFSQIVEVMFKGVRTEYFSFRGDEPLRENEYVIVQADRGQDIGWVKRAVDAATHTCDGGCDHADHDHQHPVVPPGQADSPTSGPG